MTTRAGCSYEDEDEGGMRRGRGRDAPTRTRTRWRADEDEGGATTTTRAGQRRRRGREQGCDEGGVGGMSREVERRAGPTCRVAIVVTVRFASLLYCHCNRTFAKILPY